MEVAEGKQALATQDRAAMLRDGPILKTLLRLSAPNLIALCSATVVTIAETAYVGRLGVAALGGIALVFPFIMLMQMLSAGALGGTISGAIARALGAGDVQRAEALALCALVIAGVLGITLSAALLFLGPYAFHALGGEGDVLAAATAYSHVAAFSVIGIWFANILASIARGSGNMAVPAAVLLIAGLVQILVGGTLGLGLGPFPQLGMAGVATGQLVAFTATAIVLFFYLRSSGQRLPLTLNLRLLSLSHFKDIMRVGAVAMLSPLQSVGTILVLTALVARFGAEALAGYGIGVRLEFLLIPIAFSVGVACVPMVGTAIGAGNIARARAVAWMAGGLAAVALAFIGLVLIIIPWLWVDLFSGKLAVRAVAYDYLQIAGFGFGFFGLGLCLYFASQGAGRVGGAIIAQLLRLAVVAIGGWVLVRTGAPLIAIFYLSTVAMIVMGVATATFIKFARW